MWQWLAEAWRRALQWMGQTIDAATDAAIDALEGFGGWLYRTFGDLFTALTGFFSTILRPLLDLFGGLFYLLQSLVDVLILLVQLLLLLVQVLVAIVGGLFRSLAALAAFDPASVQASPNPYQVGTDLILGQWAAAGGDVVAAVLSWAVWLALAYAVLRLFARTRPA